MAAPTLPLLSPSPPSRTTRSRRVSTKAANAASDLRATTNKIAKATRQQRRAAVKPSMTMTTAADLTVQQKILHYVGYRAPAQTTTSEGEEQERHGEEEEEGLGDAFPAAAEKPMAKTSSPSSSSISSHPSPSIPSCTINTTTTTTTTTTDTICLCALTVTLEETPVDDLIKCSIRDCDQWFHLACVGLPEHPPWYLGWNCADCLAHQRIPGNVKGLYDVKAKDSSVRAKAWLKEVKEEAKGEVIKKKEREGGMKRGVKGGVKSKKRT